MNPIGTILMIGSDEAMSELVEANIKALGMKLEISQDIDLGLKKAASENYQLILLDLEFPDFSGLEFCEQVRSCKNQVPIIVLTANEEMLDRTLALDLDADDYLNKPFSVAELFARMRTVLRKSVRIKQRTQLFAGRSIERLLVIGDLEIDLVLRQVNIGGREIKLSSKEFDLLSLLALSPGKAFSRSQLLTEIWGNDQKVYAGNINTQINRLRSKMECDKTNPRFIKTVRGLGYRLAEPQEL